MDDLQVPRGTLPLPFTPGSQWSMAPARSRGENGHSSLTSFANRWNRLRGAWDLIFVAMLCLISWPVTTRLPGGVGARMTASAGIVVTAIVFFVLGRWARRNQSAVIASVQVAIGWALLWVLTRLGLASGTWPLYVPLLIQMWASLPVTTCVAMTLLGASGSGFSWWGLRTFGSRFGEWGMRIDILGTERAASAFVESVAYSTTLVLFSLSLGLLITRMLREARELATTVDELHRTQTMLFAAEREQGRLTERQRVARDIHDTLAQGLVSLVALSRAAQTALHSSNDSQAQDHLRLMEATAADNLSEARIMVANLSPDHLTERTLVQAITRVVDLANEQGGTEYRLTITGDARPLDAHLDLTVLRIVQEGLSNVHRHASAHHATVTLDYLPRAVTIRIGDDGVGFDATAPRTGFGLDGMSARVRDVSGLYTLTSSPGVGTALTVRIPT